MRVQLESMQIEAMQIEAMQIEAMQIEAIQEQCTFLRAARRRNQSAIPKALKEELHDGA